MDTVIPSAESREVAQSLLRDAIKDRILEPIEGGYRLVAESALEARIAAAVEQSWQQGIHDAEIARRVSLLRGAICEK